MALFFFLEVSPGGNGSLPSVEDESFVPLAGPLPDMGAGFTLPHLTSDTPAIVAGHVYAYRARRFDDETGLYSLWSQTVFARAPFPWRNEIMDGILDSVLTGARSELFIGLETYEGFAVKAQKRLNYRNGGFNVDLATLFSQKLENTPAEFTQAVAGMATVNGTFLLEATPEGGYPILLKTAMLDEVSGSSAPYTHRFTNKFGAKSATIYWRVGPYILAVAGCRVGTISWDNLSAEATDIITSPVTLMGKSIALYDLNATPGAYAALGLDTAGADTLGPWSAASDALSTIGSEIGTLRSASASFNKNLGTKRTMRGKRGPSAHFENKAPVTGSAEVYFENLVHILRDWGQPADLDTTLPFGITCNVLNVPCSVAIVPCNNAGGYSNALSFVWPTAIVKAPINVGDDTAVSQSLDFTPLKVAGNASGTNFYLEMVNSISDTALSTAADAVANWPASKMDTYFSAAAAAGGTTTVFTVDAVNAASLTQTTNDAVYLAKSVLFLSGTLKGASRRITAYNATTRQFTVATAFASAPSAGDLLTVA